VLIKKQMIAVVFVR